MINPVKPQITLDPQVQRGLGLIEILVALAIGAVLLTGLVQVFLGSKLSYRVAEANARVQEGGRFATQFLATDLRMAGYMGCYRGTNPIENILKPAYASAFSFDIATPLQGFEATGAGWSPALDPAIAAEVLPGTDVVVTRGMSSDGIYLVPPFSDSAQMFVSPAGNNIEIGDVVMVTDCVNASIGEITNVQVVGGGARVNLVHSASTMNSSPPQFSYTYGADAEVARLVTHAYYISTQQLTGTGDRTEPALFRRTVLGSGMAPQELVEGAEDLQVLYGEDTDGDGIANRYVAANDVGDMGNVVSVRASLLMRTEDGIASAPQTYVYNGASHTADDRRVRRVFTTTVKLRNRGIL